MAPAESAIRREFDRTLQKCRRKNYREHDFYHPVDDIKKWMLAVSGHNNIPNSARLLQAVFTTNIFAATGPNEIRNALILFAILLKLDCGHLIHIFQQHFHDDSLDAVLPPVLSNELESSGLEYPADILEQFDQERWAFCPAKIEDMHNHTKALYGGHWILPFCKREPINEGGTARVDRVLVQEDLVPKEIKKALEGNEFTDKEFGLCYQFAIKSFRAEAQEIFQTEISNFGGIKSLPGVVRYFGWYRMEEFDHDNILRTTCNILLEYGDLDLDEFLALRYPPVLNAEIINFWENIFGVATTLDKLHNFKYTRVDGSTTTFDGWHGDVKPSNILFVRGQFKLADFGFAKFEPNRQGRPMTELYGVTHTYGAPECDPGRVRKQTITRHTQEIDTWSLGCVLSSIATWVVLGSFAYDQYQDVRKLAIADVIEAHKSNPNFTAPKATDCFHDGRHVLQAVKSWHKYLLNSMRRSDTITGDVLRFVEDKMLLSDPKDRLPSTAVARGLRDIVVSARARYAEALRLKEMPDIPAETLKALLALDDTAPPDVGLEARLSEPLADRRATILEQRTRPRTTRIKKSERLGEMVVPAKVAGRQEVLETALSQQGESYTRMGVIFESPTMKATEPSAIPDPFQLPQPQVQPAQPDQQLQPTPPAQPPQPTVVVDPPAVDPARSATDDRRSPGQPAFLGTGGPMSLNNEYGLHVSVDPAHAVHGSGDRVQTTYAGSDTSAMHSRHSSDQQSVGSPGSPTSINNEYGIYTSVDPARAQALSGYVMQPPRQSTRDTYSSGHTAFSHPYNDPRQSTGPGPLSLQRTSTLFLDDDSSDYPIAQLHRQLTRLWDKNRGFLSVLKNKIPADKRLRDFIKDRDIKFLVDNGWNMRRHWKRAKLVLETLAMKVGPLDENGLDLLFPIGQDYGKENVKGFDIPRSFRAAMDEAQAPEDERSLYTPMAKALNSILSEYYNDMSKKLTIIILTTGEWENGHTDDVERVIAENFRKMAAMHTGFYNERWCTLEFVSFGDNEQALQRLKDLDDTFSQRYGIPDVIDTEPWNGDPNQMLLGSIKSSMDNQNSRGVNSPTSPGLAGMMASNDVASASNAGNSLRAPSPPGNLSRSSSRGSRPSLGKVGKVLGRFRSQAS